MTVAPMRSAWHWRRPRKTRWSRWRPISSASPTYGDLNVTRDDIRSYTAGIVKVVDQTVTTRLEQDQVIMRVDLTAEIDPHDVVQAITALREK